jgi:hypothetical protein
MQMWKPGARRVGFPALCAVGYAIFFPHLVHADRHALVPGYRASALAVASLLDDRTSIGDLVIVDDLAAADLAHRYVVPPFCDPSNVRLLSGDLTAAQLIAGTRRYTPRVVVSSSGTFAQVPAYLAWLRRHYRSIRSPEGEAFVTR